MILCQNCKYTKYISKNNTACRPIFSDAGAAILLSKSSINTIGPFELGTDGSGADALELPMNTNEIVMNGAKVLTFAMNVVPDNVNSLLKKINNFFRNEEDGTWPYHLTGGEYGKKIFQKMEVLCCSLINNITDHK